MNALLVGDVETVQARLQRVVETHFDPAWGSAFWLDRARAMGIDPLRQIYRLEDLALLGDMSPDDLRGRPLLDFVPRRFHQRMDHLLIGQTGGTTGPGTWTAYHEDEFVEAFVLPFVSAASHVGFPARESWLFIGPSGPHVIGKVVRHLASALGSADPFSVDFDPRWAKKLAENTMGRRRYLAHVVEQAMDVIGSQEIGVLFTTPPVLEALAEAMGESQRLRIRGVHYGGMEVTPAQLRRFQEEAFPQAVHLSGYGNTLFGCCLELGTAPGRDLDYYPHGNRLILEVVDEEGRLTKDQGRVRFTRLDETMLIVRMLERDTAMAIAPPAGAPGEFRGRGVRNPHFQAATAPRAAVGLY